MKHTLAITLVLVAVFFLAQVIGLIITDLSIEKKAVDESGNVNVTYSGLPMGMERPDLDKTKPQNIVAFIVVAILIGTTLVLILRKFNAFRTWKIWFLMSVTICLTIAFNVLLKKTPLGNNAIYSAASFAIILSVLKVYRPNFIIHNFTEIFVYGGLAVIFVPILSFKSVVLILLVISVYDMIAVWQSKHMVKLAKFQTESKVFAGLAIPYTLPKHSTGTKQSTTAKKEEVKSAILGGGDVGFPLLFAGVLMEQFGMLKVMIIPVMASIGLFLLLYYAKKDRFYPAMPFLSAACFAGYGLILLL